MAHMQVNAAGEVICSVGGREVVRCQLPVLLALLLDELRAGCRIMDRDPRASI